MTSDIKRIEQEDLVMFINACFACTGQAEFYSEASEQMVSIKFLHEYILVNYRRLYARALSAGINHFNQGQIIVNLLKAGAPSSPEDRTEEGQLIMAALRTLPPQRAFRVLRALREHRVNNRRTRAIIRDYCKGRPDAAFDAVKYRNHLHAVARHAHLKLSKELGTFLFEGVRGHGAFESPLLDAFRRAHYDQRAVYELPFTIAEGFAAQHGIPRGTFLSGIAPRMTANERLRLQRVSEKEKGVTLEIDLSRAPLTRLALYVLSLPNKDRVSRHQEFHTALENAAHRALKRAPIRLGRVAAVLDRSYSALASTQKKHRPLAVALGVHYLLRAAAAEYRAFWTFKTPDVLRIMPKGQTDLATPLLDALDWRPDLVVIVSDAVENDPPQGAAEVARIFRLKIDRKRETAIIHMNPVFDAVHYAPKRLSTAIPTVGLRDAEDLATTLEFARFADGSASLAQLMGYLESRIRHLFQHVERLNRATHPPKD